MLTLRSSILVVLSVLPLAAAPSMTMAKPKPGAPAVSAADQALIDKAATYLQGLRSAQAKFSQTDPRGTVTTGVFSLQRPGKARFAYDPPAELTVVADGTNVNVADGKLKTFDQYPEKNTPLSLLLSDTVKFDKAAVVTAVMRDKSGFTLVARDATKQAEGKLSLHFSTAPMALTGWSVVDAQNQTTAVRLEGFKTGVALGADLFVLHDPHPHTFKP
jgi:outer membrane lipoprotein-sorting protein